HRAAHHGEQLQEGLYRAHLPHPLRRDGRAAEEKSADGRAISYRLHHRARRTADFGRRGGDRRRRRLRRSRRREGRSLRQGRHRKGRRSTQVNAAMTVCEAARRLRRSFRRLLGAGASAAIAVLMVLWALPLNAQTYPDRPIRVIVPIAAGSVTDVIMRATANELTPRLGQSFVIENKGGASGIPGAQACAQAAPDGYTLCLVYHNTLSINPLLFNKLPYDPDRDFTLISNLYLLTEALFVNSSLNVSTPAELKAYAQALPGRAQLRHARAGLQSGNVFEVDEPDLECEHRRHSLPRRRADRASPPRRRIAGRQDGAGEFSRSPGHGENQAACGRRGATLDAVARDSHARRGRDRLSAVRLVGIGRSPLGAAADRGETQQRVRQALSGGQVRRLSRKAGGAPRARNA